MSPGNEISADILTRVNRMLHRISQQVLVSQEIRRFRGEDFNVFHVLRIGHLEEQTHSRFLAYLLEPRSDLCLRENIRMRDARIWIGILVLKLDFLGNRRFYSWQFTQCEI